MLAEPVQTSIIGMMLVELLDGKLSDETIAAVDSIKREDVPAPLSNLVGMIHGMSTHAPLRDSQITSLVGEILSAAQEILEKRTGQPTQWGLMNDILNQVMQGGNIDIRGNVDPLTEAGLDLAEHSPAWTQPLVQHIVHSTSENDQLTLELLDMLEAQIKTRRAELSK